MAQWPGFQSCPQPVTGHSTQVSLTRGLPAQVSVTLDEQPQVLRAAAGWSDHDGLLSLNAGRQPTGTHYFDAR